MDSVLPVLIVVLGLISFTSTANVALNKWTSQRGVYGGLTSDLAVDGRYWEPNFGQAFCAHPNIGPAEWQVDLGGRYTINNITLYNTYDEYGARRFSSFKVNLLDDTGLVAECGDKDTSDGTRGEVWTAHCPAIVIGRYVQVLRYDGGFQTWAITLCEVEVYGQLFEGIAYQKSTNQTGQLGAMSSDRAVDGRYGDPSGDQTYCAHPNWPSGEPAEWWLNLETMYSIDSITLYNTYDTGGYQRFTSFTVGILDGVNAEVICGNKTTPSSPGEVVTFSCPPDSVAQYVHVKRYGGSLRYLITLCEVEVSGSIVCGQCQNSPCDPVSGVCAGGCELWWIGDMCTTNIARPNYTDQQITTSSVTNSTINLEWGQISVPGGLETYYKYSVAYSPSPSTDPQYVQQTAGVSTLSATLYNLQPNTEYVITVTPVREMRDEQDTGTPYPTQTVTTVCGYPDPAQIVTVAQSNFRISITYTLPTVFNCDSLQNIKVYYKLESGTSWREQTASLTDTTVDVNVTQAGSYKVRLIVINSYDLVSYSDVRDVTVMETTTTSITTPTTTTITTTKATGGETDESTGEDSDLITIVAAVVASVVVVAVIIILVVVFLRRRKQQKEPVHMIPEDTTGSNGGFENPDPNIDVQSVASVDSEPTPPPVPAPMLRVEPNAYMNSPAVPVDQLEAFVAKKKQNMDTFTEEYKSLPDGDPEMCKVAAIKENKLKNRFLNMYPYDHNRVILKREKGTDESEYINASPITGYQNKKDEYIATQGPRTNTVTDFWRMVWQKNVSRIVMVANIVEDAKRRVEQYWPEEMGTSNRIGHFIVRLDGAEVCADYTTRMLTVSKGKESRTVRQFHFTSWRDKSRPQFGAHSLIAFKKKVRHFDRLSKGPLLVHCSAGVGRTGTFIAFDILTKQIQHEKQVDIYGCIEKLREDRTTMVQTKDQFFFLHEALVEAVKIGDTSYPCNNLPDKLEELKSPGDTGRSEIVRQYQLLQELKGQPQLELEQEAFTAENKSKNRDMNIIPANGARPFLARLGGQRNSYINCVYVDSFKQHNFYIVTQSPLPGTVADFWNMVYSQTCSTIVMLNQLDEEDEDNSPQYWPEEEEMEAEYGPITVHILKTQQLSASILMREFRVVLTADEDEQVDLDDGDTPNLTVKGNIVRHFQLLGWSDSEELPAQRGSLLDILDQVQRWQQQNNNETRLGEIVVQCLDGGRHSGLFCGVAHTLERMKIEQEVDPFLAARYVSRYRPQFFSTENEYVFLFEMAIECMNKFDTYANFQ